MPVSELIDEVEFTCPRCGGHQFGTTLDMTALADPMSGEGVCHGYLGFGRPCGFTWPRRDDAKHFRPTGRKMPRVHVGVGTTK